MYNYVKALTPKEEEKMFEYYKNEYGLDLKKYKPID